MSPGDRILLAHGDGGRLGRALIEELIVPHFGGLLADQLSDAAVLPALPPGRPAFTTDGFVVDPPIFPGGDLGALAITGTLNDLAVAGARPAWLSLALIIEEGTPLALLEHLVGSAARIAREAGVPVVAGDTKVVPRGKGDGVYATTAGLGVVPPGRELGDARIRPGDRLLASGPLGDHGAAIMASRHGLAGPVSDCAFLGPLVEALLAGNHGVRAIHDPTRGGALAVCHEVAARAGARMLLLEESLPIRPAVGALCELLGLDALSLACEGRLLAWVAPEHAEEGLARLRAEPAGGEAALIGEVLPAAPGAPAVLLETRYGQRRPLDLRAGLGLPRIC